ncbi:hypothetical protein E1161_25530 [Saccharopolyspora aridisoli]|uniref:Uncharacterized protein n=1 Tax=Saccharopolyspora aridisoli TaxID=2530385 RepID=A0A4R4UF82_9PSEU|nr:hypothetical protein [Saccharopolyspora aridisoli]TDC87534.1 hypothetical protein E1161_25530 [Saccharopolyspora aridisoli]
MPCPPTYSCVVLLPVGNGGGQRCRDPSDAIATLALVDPQEIDESKLVQLLHAADSAADNGSTSAR